MGYKMNTLESRSGFTAVIFFLSLAISSVPASAIEPGWYGGIAIGEAEIEDVGAIDNLCADVSVVCNETDADTGWQGIVGYQVNEYFGAEGAYFDLGSPAVSVSSPVAAAATADLTGVSFSAVPQIPLGTVGAIFGRIGLAVGKVELSAAAPSLGLSASESTDGATLLYGVGGAINFSSNAAVRVEWTRYAIDETLRIANSEITTPDIDFISAALVFSFR
jgi:hypothetical protein